MPRDRPLPQYILLGETALIVDYKRDALQGPAVRKQTNIVASVQAEPEENYP